MHIIEFETRIKHKGNEAKEVHWVHMANSLADSLKTSTWEPVEHLRPKRDTYGDVSDQNHKDVIARWDNFIGPAYEAWLKGQEIPTKGIALSNWNALTKDQLKAFRAAGLQSIEQVAEMDDATMRMVRLPNLYSIKMLAEQFIENLANEGAAAEMAEMRNQMAAMKAELESLKKPKRRGRPPKAPVIEDESEAA